jgi:acetoin utilization deacetylase AcuC-like enzyme
MVTIVYSPTCVNHRVSRSHPERPERVTVCAEALEHYDFNPPLTWVAPRPATLQELSWIHTPSYIAQVEALARRGGGMLDADTAVSTGSYEVALLTAGGWLVGVDHVLDQQQSAFVLARPPGHHARPAAGMGFCIFGNAALAAWYAYHVKGCKKVAVFDWDVHHGNGTQEMLENYPQFAYCSIHQADHYPGTGFAQETGAYENVLNIPLPASTSRPTYQSVLVEQVLPFLKAFAPDLLIISAGFDALRADPLADMVLEPEDYATFTQQCLTVVPHVLCGLEGGYELTALSQAVVNVVQALQKT